MKTTGLTPRGALQEEAAEQADVASWSAEQAREWRKRHRILSPWWVIAGQLMVGALAMTVGWLLTGSSGVTWSLGYGVLSVVVPAALFARGLTGRLSSVNPVMAALGFLLWEMVKLALTMAMLVAAPRLVPGLSWLALLVGLVLALKVYWLALLYAPKNVKLKDE